MIERRLKPRPKSSFQALLDISFQHARKLELPNYAPRNWDRVKREIRLQEFMAKS